MINITVNMLNFETPDLTPGIELAQDESGAYKKGRVKIGKHNIAIHDDLYQDVYYTYNIALFNYKRLMDLLLKTNDDNLKYKLDSLGLLRSSFDEIFKVKLYHGACVYLKRAPLIVNKRNSSELLIKVITKKEEGFVNILNSSNNNKSLVKFDKIRARNEETNVFDKVVSAVHLYELGKNQTLDVSKRVKRGEPSDNSPYECYTFSWNVTLLELYKKLIDPVDDKVISVEKVREYNLFDILTMHKQNYEYTVDLLEMLAREYKVS